MKSKPACEDLISWLKLRSSSITQVPDTDLQALHIEAHLMQLWAFGDLDARTAVKALLPLVLGEIQFTTSPLAYDAIAHGLDWSDRDKLWPWPQGFPASGLPAYPIRKGRRGILPKCTDEFKRLHQAQISLAPLTGQDRAALETAMHIIPRWQADPMSLSKMLHILRPAMQPSTFPHVLHCLAHWLGRNKAVRLWHGVPLEAQLV